MRMPLAFVAVLLSPLLSFTGGRYELPPLPPPDRYGEVRMEPPAAGKMPPVTFSHWIHRARYTCSVCHYELGFAMRRNDTPIVCDGGTMQGRYCARCHDGKTAFGPADKGGRRCEGCHGADETARRIAFGTLRGKLPKSRYGNRIDWSVALGGRYIRPIDTLSGEPRKLANLNETLTLKAEMWGIPPAVFPHKTHEEWLDCSSCHPDLFQIKVKTTKTLRMEHILTGESCGVCHLRVAFPLDDCKRCHPKMR